MANRSTLLALVNTIGSNEANTAAELRAILTQLVNGSILSGTVILKDVTNAYISTNFDGTGLGINEEVGNAICNGNNGTRNWNGRVPVAYGTAYQTMGATSGAATHTLTIAEMPSHGHAITQNANNVEGAGKVSVGATAAEGIAPTTDNTGGGAAHNNMQPYIVTLAIMKL